jgi:hypothetical protein
MQHSDLMSVLRLALPAAAVLAAVSLAQAAEPKLGRLPAPPETSSVPLPEAEPDSADNSGCARICDGFGPGFTYSPGTGACIKINGYVKFGTSFGGTSGSAVRSGAGKFELR